MVFNNFLLQWGNLILPTLGGLVAFLLGLAITGPLLSLVDRKTRARAEKLALTLDNIFITVSLPKCLLIVYLSAAVPALALFLLTLHLGWVSLFFGAAAGAAGWFIPKFWVDFLRRRHLAAFESQLVDALTMISNGLHSSLSLDRSLEMVSREMDPPIKQEFAKVIWEHKTINISLEESLQRMQDRLPSKDLALVINSVDVLREKGGSLREIFETVLMTVVKRKEVEGKIKAMTSQGVTQGVIVAAMPFVLALVLHMTNPEYLMPLYTTVIGWFFILFILALIVGGSLMMRSIVKIDV